MFKNRKFKFALILAVFLLYFQYSVTIAWDSAHYMSYVNIFEGNQAWNTWNVVRGPVFPLIIFTGNFFFGKTAQGLTVMTFVFYLCTLWFYLKMFEEFLDNLNISNRKKQIIEYVLLIFTILNPIIFGYFHCLLTEFVAINISVMSCYFSYKWLNSDFFETRLKYIMFSIYFIILVPLSWNLKQPYVSCAFFPFIVSYIISIFENRKLKKIIVRTSTLFCCAATLFFSIILWNSFLKKNGVDPSEDRNPTVMFSTQMLNGTGVVRVEDSESIKNFKSYVEKTKLNRKEINEIRNHWLNGRRFFILNTYKNGKIINSDYVYNGDNRISFFTAFSYIIKTFFEHPALLSMSYASNYLATIDIYQTELDSGGGYSNLKIFDLNFSNEISSLGYRIYNYNVNNILSVTPEMYENVKHYEQNNKACIYVNYFMNVLAPIYLLIYKLLFFLLPFVFIVTIVFRIREKNNIIKLNYNLCIILLGYSFLHVFLHVFMGALIDRYTVPAILTNFLGILCFMFCMIEKSKKELKK